MDLIKQKKWFEFIDSLKTDKILDKDKAKKLLKEKIEAAIKESAKRKIGIMFSGGIDSSFIAFICKKLKLDFTCYSVGLEKSHDLQWAEKAAIALNLKLKTRVFTLEQALDNIKKTKKLLKTDNVVKIGVGAVVYSAMEIAKKDNIKTVFSGLGSEEIFAGYQRHENAKDINKECWFGLKDMWQRDLTRDVAITNHFKIDLATPFLDKDVIKTAMQVAGKHKMSKEYKKLILREIAEELGIPKEISWHRKKAAQYGSGFDKAISKLARKAGFNYKKDFLKNLK